MEGLLWLLVFAAFFYFMMRFGCGAHMVHGGHAGADGAGSPAGIAHGSHGERSREDREITDPVCGMRMIAETGYNREYQGRSYRFCSQECLDQFDAEPARYTGEKELTR